MQHSLEQGSETTCQVRRSSDIHDLERHVSSSNAVTLLRVWSRRTLLMYRWNTDGILGKLPTV